MRFYLEAVEESEDASGNLRPTGRTAIKDETWPSRPMQGDWVPIPGGVPPLAVVTHVEFRKFCVNGTIQTEPVAVISVSELSFSAIAEEAALAKVLHEARVEAEREKKEFSAAVVPGDRVTIQRVLNELHNGEKPWRVYGTKRADEVGQLDLSAA